MFRFFRQKSLMSDSDVPPTHSTVASATVAGGMRSSSSSMSFALFAGGDGTLVAAAQLSSHAACPSVLYHRLSGVDK